MTENPNGPPADTPGVIAGESAIAALAPGPLLFNLAGSSPPEAEQSAGIPAGTPIYQALTPDGLLNVLAYQTPGGWVLEVAHVLAGLLGADGFPKAGRPPHLWELRAARARFIPGDVVLGLLLLPPDLPAPRPPNCVMLTQVGEVKRSGLTLV